MNNAGFLKEDFKQITTNSDDAVFEMLKTNENKNAAENPNPTRTIKPAARTLRNEAAQKPNRHAKTSDKTDLAKNLESIRWGKPVVLFNTRIPEELSGLLDDLVYESKKEGNPITKQSIAIDALAEFLNARGLLRQQ